MGTTERNAMNALKGLDQWLADNGEKTAEIEKMGMPIHLIANAIHDSETITLPLPVLENYLMRAFVRGWQDNTENDDGKHDCAATLAGEAIFEYGDKNKDVLEMLKRAADGYRTFIRILNRTMPGWSNDYAFGETLAEMRDLIRIAEQG